MHQVNKNSKRIYKNDKAEQSVACKILQVDSMFSDTLIQLIPKIANAKFAHSDGRAFWQ